MNETQLTTQVKNYIKSQGAYCEKIFGGGFQSAGIPDLICCYKGIFIAIELKSPTGKGRASDVQKLKIREIGLSGGLAVIVDNLQDVIDLFEMVDNNYPHDLINASFNNYL